MEQKNKTIVIGLALVVVIILSSNLWYRIFNRASSNPSTTAGVAQPAAQNNTDVVSSTGPDVSPVLRAEVPKLAGSVIVGPKVATKFYLSRNGKRYVFPDETKTFDTWFPSGTKIVSLTETELESYPLGGNVCYRPGTRLIRIASDPHIFAVAHNCVLRAINDGNAEKLFGKNWHSLVDTLQDYYFTNYAIGTQISSAADYSSETERGTSPTIDADKNIQ